MFLKYFCSFNGEPFSHLYDDKGEVPIRSEQDLVLLGPHPDEGDLVGGVKVAEGRAGLEVF